MGILGRPHWVNLVAWCRLVFDGECPWQTSARNWTHLRVVVVAALEIAHSVADAKGSWELVTKPLVSHRKTAGRVDERWLEDL